MISKYYIPEPDGTLKAVTYDQWLFFRRNEGQRFTFGSKITKLPQGMVSTIFTGRSTEIEGKESGPFETIVMPEFEYEWPAPDGEVYDFRRVYTAHTHTLAESHVLHDTLAASLVASAVTAKDTAL